MTTEDPRLTTVGIPDHLAAIVSTTFTYECKWCGTTIQVEDTRQLPHECTIIVDEP